MKSGVYDRKFSTLCRVWGLGVKVCGLGFSVRTPTLNPKPEPQILHLPIRSCHLTRSTIPHTTRSAIPMHSRLSAPDLRSCPLL